jgi:glycerophosphoryl diester phosphodiesterase
MTGPLIIAHRGVSARAPENTLAAFQMAIDAGAEGLEFDVRLAKDGVPVVTHDHDLKRVGSRNERVAALTSDELGKIDVGSWFNHRYPKRAQPEFVNQTVPTLKQVLDLLADFGGLIYIELKPRQSDFHKLSEAVCNLIKGSGVASADDRQKLQACGHPGGQAFAARRTDCGAVRSRDNAFPAAT